MNEKPLPSQTDPDDESATYDLTERDAVFFATHVKEIAASLRSIKSMLQFFVVLTILAIIVQACTVLGLL
jgi:hypothetical protein